MPEKIINNSKITNLLIYWSKRVKTFYKYIAAYFVILICYDLIMYKRPLKQIIITYLTLIFVGFFVWFGVKLVFWIQIKNISCSEKMFNIFSVAACIVFGVGSIFIGIEYFFNEFTYSAFLGPVIIVSVLKVQSLRKINN